MAREVNTVLAEIIAEHRGITEQKAEDVVKSMRSANQYQVCLCFIIIMGRGGGPCRAGGPLQILCEQEANTITGGRLVIEYSLPAPGLAFRDKRVRGGARLADTSDSNPAHLYLRHTAERNGVSDRDGGTKN